MQNLRISLIQSDLSWEDKDSNLSMFEDKIRSIELPTELILLPEMFSTGFSMNPGAFAEEMDGKSVSWMRRVSAETRSIIAGSLIIADGGKYYNRLIWMQPNGQLGYYDKRHCFGLAGEDRHYHRGNKRLIASVKGWRVNLNICYDLRFPVWSRQQTSPAAEKPEYDLLVYVANWPESRIQAWKSLLVARAIENQCYVAGVNRVGKDGEGKNHSGSSMVVDPYGSILKEISGSEGMIHLQLDGGQLVDIRQKLPFWRDGDEFTIHQL